MKVFRMQVHLQSSSEKLSISVNLSALSAVFALCSALRVHESAIGRGIFPLVPVKVDT